MNKDKAATHGVNSFVQWVQRALDVPHELGDHFREDFALPLTAATDVVFRVVLEINPMQAVPDDIKVALEGSPDEELRQACDKRIPDRRGLIDWLRTDEGWSPDELRAVIERLSGTDWTLCGPGCAHERAAMVAYHASRVFDRIASLVGDRNAAIVTAEATSIGNDNPFRSRSGDLVLELVARDLGWTPAVSEQLLESAADATEF